MRDVAIIGIGQTPVGEHWDSSLRMLAADAARAALEDSGRKEVEAVYVANAYASTLSSQSQLGALVADYTGLGNIEAYTIEAGDASGGAALRAGYLAVASGAVDVAMVLGVEKSTDMVGSSRVRARSVSLDADYEAIHGATLTSMAALLMRRYMYEFGVGLDAFEGFSINAHANAKTNNFAMYHNTLKPGAFSKAGMVADPVTLFDGAPDADGSAAVILAAADHAVDMVPHPVRIVGSAAATDTIALQDRVDPLILNAVNLSAYKAYAQAGIQPEDVNLFELHDAYTILSALALEAAGFAGRGEGWKLAQSGAVGLKGALPVCTFGGLKARGNPAGAAGIYQAVEAVLQLRGQAGANQVDNAKVALIQSLGGLASTAVTHVLSI
jgi:acetyl-CoA C-acetyltransferase